MWSLPKKDLCRAVAGGAIRLLHGTRHVFLLGEYAAFLNKNHKKD
jgi:hypothetical protein